MGGKGKVKGGNEKEVEGGRKGMDVKSVKPGAREVAIPVVRPCI